MGTRDFTTMRFRPSNLRKTGRRRDFSEPAAPWGRLAPVYAACAPERPAPLTESEIDLLRRCQRGDEPAWRELVSRYTRRVFSLAYRFTGRVDEAEDLTQEVFVKVYQTLDKFAETEGSFPAWLMTVARNKAIDNYRRKKEEHRRKADDPEILDFAASGEEGPLRRLERSERVALVHRGLRALPLDLREPLILCDLQGLPYEEAARTLEVPLGTLKSRINRGRLELAKRLTRFRGELAGC
jgi:RNA polymerase sigma-70 factor (ECF subfamily)